MDEPFGALDHQTRELMQELLLGIWEAERTTVLFVTHDIDEAVFMGSRVMVMSARPGRIKLDRVVPLAHPRARRLCGLTFELSGRRRQAAKPGLVKMYRVPLGACRAFPATASVRQLGQLRHCKQTVTA